MIFSQLVLNWYHLNGRKNLPWQKKRTPYRIWVSEIMLQQTKVNTVIPYFEKFIKAFPTINKLAESKLNQILYFWSGLGYYARAKNLYKSAKLIKKKYNGIFPDNFTEIIQLPGIGKTTAGAILSLSFGFSFSILDGNVKRILNRYYQINNVTLRSKIEMKLWILIQKITPIYHTRQFNQGLMDIGSSICTPNKPKCYICPISLKCFSYNDSNFLKKKINKIKLKINPKKYFFLIIKYKKFTILKKIESKKIWGDLFSFPIFKTEIEIEKWIKKNNVKIIKKEKKSSFIHSFTHFKIKIFPIFFFISEKFDLLDTKNYIWYNTEKPIYIGIPKPTEKILKKYFSKLT
ncbi:A/G-specific adenine glycosylase [Buchnera aphidicola]|uniref:A/G-specific adenine glycosylase n=1 Tax=Buchnera aphidicola TaxID=9 RepID=UPI003463A0B1